MKNGVLATLALTPTLACAPPQSSTAPPSPPTTAATTPTPLGRAVPPPTGRAGDFAFLTGSWHIHNRRLKDDRWEEFPGEATVWSTLEGLASIEELRIPPPQVLGMGLRLLDVERGLWADYWVPRARGALAATPVWGSFVDGVGTWVSEEPDGTGTLLVKGVWDEITPTSCRWYQAVSRNGGQTWEENWVMRWTRR